jgi:hypothetical protein
MQRATQARRRWTVGPDAMVRHAAFCAARSTISTMSAMIAVGW